MRKSYSIKLLFNKKVTTDEKGCSILLMLSKKTKLSTIKFTEAFCKKTPKPSTESKLPINKFYNNLMEWVWTEKDFDIIDWIGKGSFSEVFLAIEKNSQVKVALKKISKQLLINTQSIYRAWWEIEVHYWLDHKNVIKIYGYYFNNKQIVIV